jgi:putative transposase
MVIVANIHDSKAAYLLMRVLKELCSGLKIILADGAYRGERIECVKNRFGYLLQVIVSSYKEQGFRSVHKRWIIERTFFWLDNNRSLCWNYELTFDSAKEMVKIAPIKLLLKKI